MGDEGPFGVPGSILGHETSPPIDFTRVNNNVIST